MCVAFRKKQRTVSRACLLCCLLTATAGGNRLFAADAPNVSADVAIVGPMIGETTALVVKVDTTRLYVSDLLGILKQSPPVAEGLETLKAAAGGQAVYATVGIPLSQSEWPFFVFLKSTPDVDQKRLFERLGAAMRNIKPHVHNGLIVATPVSGGDVAAAVDAITPSPRDELDDAFEAVAQYPIQALLLPPDYVRRTVVELMPQLPRQLGGGPSDVLTDGLVWAALGVDPAERRAQLVVQSTSEEAARRLAERLPKMLQSAYDGMPDLQHAINREAFQSLLAQFAPRVEGDRVVLQVVPDQSMRLVVMVATAIEERIRQVNNVDKFKQILLAMHNYHDRYQSFPPRKEARDAGGRSGLSWRVHLLPFLEEQNLYNEFHLDEPWDSAHNKRLVERMPKIYQGARSGVAAGHTTFLAPVGEDTVYGGTKPVGFSDINDGTSNTVVLVEVKPELAVPWTAPQDYAFDPASPGSGLYVYPDGRLLAGMADGSVRRLLGKVEPEMLLRLLRKSDGNVVDWNEFR